MENEIMLLFLSLDSPAVGKYIYKIYIFSQGVDGYALIQPHLLP